MFRVHQANVKMNEMRMIGVRLMICALVIIIQAGVRTHSKVSIFRCRRRRRIRKSRQNETKNNQITLEIHRLCGMSTSVSV